MIFEKNRIYVGYGSGFPEDGEYVKFFKCINNVIINGTSHSHFIELITLRYSDGVCNYSDTTLNDKILECKRMAKSGHYHINKYRIEEYNPNIIYKSSPETNYTAEMFERDFKGNIIKF